VLRVTLFVPTLNEIEGVKAVMPRIDREWVDEILIIHGHSTDGTVEWLESHGYQVIPQAKPGLLNAWWQGFETAKGDVIIPFSPDNNSVPEVIPRLIEKIREGYDVVIASRYMEGAVNEDDTVITRFGNRLFTRMINILFGGRYTDAMGMYKAFRKSIITDLRLDDSKDEIFEILLAARAAKHRLRVTEIPGDEPKRIGGDDSRAWPGLRGRFMGGLFTLRCIIKEAVRGRT
jgi:glycosyltransferase involved in cell wall biosynthesis